uniref:Uncharacterized protein n=1 Tax=Balaenoptera musculus TaxID=9771 RepID=A0A8C0HYJ5_BALMU
MNPSTHTITPHQHKPGSIIHTSDIKSSRILHSVIWLGLQLKICINWSPTSGSTNNLIRSNTSNHPLISTLNKWILYPINPHHNTRTTMTSLPFMTTSQNMIYFYPSRNQPSPF